MTSTPTPGGDDGYGSSYTRKQRLDLLSNLVSLFYVDIADDDWVNSREVQLCVKQSIKIAVGSASNFDEVLNSDILKTIFSEFKKHRTAREYSRYLYEELVDSKISLDSLSEKAAED